MFHPSILAAYRFKRMCLNPIDTCTDVAEYNGIPSHTLARFLVAMGIDTDRLSLLA